MVRPVTAPWWSAHVHADRRESLRLRARIKAAIRRWLEQRDFAEVECGILQESSAVETHLHAFATELIAPDGARRRLYLHTSPEFASKKLLAAGERRIFDFARVFRNRERGPLHAPEFTMLEWYRAEESYEAVIDDSLEIVRLTAEEARADAFSFRGRVCDPHAQPQRITVAEAFDEYAGIDLASSLSADGEGDAARLSDAARAAGFEAGDGDGWGDLFSKILIARIEPRLGLDRPAILHEYPRCQAALARAVPHDLRMAERFELYVCGVELANGFGELADPIEQRRRLEHELAEKARIYGERIPIDENFLAALGEMPEASGVALGFDRLVMLAAGARTLDDVIWTPSPEAG